MSVAATSKAFTKGWIAAVLGGKVPQWHGDSLSVESCVAQAKQEGVAALLYACLRAAPDAVPEALLSALAVLNAQAVAVEMLREVQTQRVLAELVNAELPFLLLKGGALAHWAFDSAYQRSRDDLDLLFADQSSAQQCEVLLLNLGYRVVDSQTNGPNFERCLRLDSPDGLSWWIDVHWRMSNHPAFAERFSFAELFDRSLVLSGNYAIRGLGAVHAFLHAAIHRLSNLLIGSGDRLIWLFDLHQIARHLCEEDWAQLVEIAKTRQLAGPCISSMDRCSALFSTRWPPLVLKELRILADSESFKVEHAHTRWYFEWQSFRSLPAARRLDFLFRKLWPTRSYMYERYQLTDVQQLPFAYLRRWRTGLSIVWRTVVRRV